MLSQNSSLFVRERLILIIANHIFKVSYRKRDTYLNDFVKVIRISHLLTCLFDHIFNIGMCIAVPLREKIQINISTIQNKHHIRARARDPNRPISIPIITKNLTRIEFYCKNYREIRVNQGTTDFSGNYYAYFL